MYLGPLAPTEESNAPSDCPSCPYSPDFVALSCSVARRLLQRRQQTFALRVRAIAFWLSNEQSVQIRAINNMIGNYGTNIRTSSH